MSKVYADTVEASGEALDLILGGTGDSVTLAGNQVNANIVQDSGGNILFQSDGAGTLSNVNAGFAYNLRLISTQVAGGEDSIDFTTGIDSTYDTYIFQLISVSPGTDTAYLQFAASKDGGTSWANNITASFFAANHSEGDSASLGYQSDRDTANATPCKISSEMGNSDDEAGSITMHLFSPSNTLRAKNFYTTGQIYQSSNYATNDFVAGYINTSDAVNAIKFYYTTGTVMRGTFKLYGLL